MRHTLIAISKAKAKLLELTRKANDEGKAFILTKDGEAIGALVPMENYESFLETSDVLSDHKTFHNLEMALKDEKARRFWKRDSKGRWTKVKKKSAA